jgi:hypothetical protein
MIHRCARVGKPTEKCLLSIVFFGTTAFSILAYRRKCVIVITAVIGVLTVHDMTAEYRCVEKYDIYFTTGQFPLRTKPCNSPIRGRLTVAHTHRVSFIDNYPVHFI